MPTAFSYNAFLFSRERLFQAVTPAPDLSLFSVRLPPEFYRETQSENILLSVVKPDYHLFQSYLIEPVSVIVIIAYLIHLRFIEKICFFKKVRFCCLEITFLYKTHLLYAYIALFCEFQ